MGRTGEKPVWTNERNDKGATAERGIFKKQKSPCTLPEVEPVKGR